MFRVILVRWHSRPSPDITPTSHFSCSAIWFLRKQKSAPVRFKDILIVFITCVKKCVWNKTRTSSNNIKMYFLVVLTSLNNKQIYLFIYSNFYAFKFSFKRHLGIVSIFRRFNFYQVGLEPGKASLCTSPRGSLARFWPEVLPRPTP